MVSWKWLLGGLGVVGLFALVKGGGAGSGDAPGRTASFMVRSTGITSDIDPESLLMSIGRTLRQRGVGGGVMQSARLVRNTGGSNWLATLTFAPPVPETLENSLVRSNDYDSGGTNSLLYIEGSLLR